VWDSVHIRTGAKHRQRLHRRREDVHRVRRSRIGNLVKLNACVYICAGVTIEDRVMISAGTVFTNDTFPRATDPDEAGLMTSAPTGGNAADLRAKRA